jgi:hypothetical protein
MSTMTVQVAYADADAEAAAKFVAEFGDAADFTATTDAPDVALVLLGERTFADEGVDAVVRDAVSGAQPQAVVVSCLDRNAQSSRLSLLVRANVEKGYALFYRRPLDASELRKWLEKATEARSRIAPVRVWSEWFETEPDNASWMPDTTWKH